jgi:transcriptional regulator with XRE-family HTH domain
MSWLRELGDQIRSKRLKAGLTQEGLARKLSVTREQLSNYENGKSAPSVNIVTEIAEALGVELVVRGYKITAADVRPSIPPVPKPEQLTLTFGTEHKFRAASVSLTPTTEDDSITLKVTFSRSQSG